MPDLPPYTITYDEFKRITRPPPPRDARGRFTRKDKEPVMAYKQGDKIQVSFGALVTGDIENGPSITTRVREKTGNKLVHYLFLASRDITGDKITGGTVEADFTATITGEIGADPSGTTRVDSTYNTHYLYLDSPFITKVPDAAAEEALGQLREKLAPERRFAVGQRIHVEFTGAVLTGNGNQNSTTKVRDANGTVHYLYLGSESWRQILKNPGRAIPVIGDTIRVCFDTELTTNTFTSTATPAGTNRVLGPGSPPGAASSRYVHYLNLDSPSVTAIPDAVDQFIAGTAITSEDEEISSLAVRERVIELTAGRKTWTITRNRDGQRIGDEFPSRNAALAFLDNEDYYTARFTVKTTAVLTPAETEELKRLTALDTTGITRFGASWTDPGVTLFRYRFFNADWARQQAVDKIGIDPERLDNWPLDLINWDDAATDLRDEEYLRILFSDINYYGKKG